jgi:hypothetical protein
MELVCLFKIVEVLIDAPAGCTLEFWTDLPGNALAQRSQAVIGATTGRHPYRMVLSGATKGKLYQLKIFPAGGVGMSIFSAKVYARPLGPPALPWAWYTVPGIFPTQDDWSEMKLPIDPTSDLYTSLKLPIDETSDVFASMKLPIDPTADTYTSMRLPIDPTADTYASMQLPVKPTPVVPDWVSLPVDQ